MMRWTLVLAILCGALTSGWSQEQKRNIVVIVTDDQRWDAMGFLDHPFLETPNMDRMAKRGAHFKNAFVTTSLCSPSRGSILSGLYVHNHGVVDNYNAIPEGVTWFPSYLQEAGYKTAMIGKWHMGGEIDDPQPGFDHWHSFKGQGVYYTDPADAKVKGRYVPQVTREGYNINGERRPQNDYITDELTAAAVDWLGEQEGSEKPWFLYFAHKAVHADFIPANRHAFKYDSETWERPKSWFEAPEMFTGTPVWVKNQRNSRHGVEFSYYMGLDLGRYYRRYCETLLAVDEGIGDIFTQLEKMGELESTLVIYLSDNGFLFGEHGLIDKRCAYEESIRIPMLAHCPDIIKPGTVVEEVVANIDIAPTVLEAAGVPIPKQFDGQSFYKLATGEGIEKWRDYLLYEYFWERNYPQTPTMHALRGERFKYIRYHGIWDTDELYDLQVDPEETTNLINDPEYTATAKQLNGRLFEILDETSGRNLSIGTDRGTKFLHRREGGAPASEFPEWFYREADKPANAK